MHFTTQRTVFMCCVQISEQTAIISLFEINSPVFITKMEYVYCAVRTEYLRKMQVNFLKRWGLDSTLDNCMWFLWWTKLHWDTFSSEYFRFLLSPFFHHCFKLIFICMLFLSERKVGEIWEPSEKLRLLGNRVTLDSEILSLRLQNVNRHS